MLSLKSTDQHVVDALLNSPVAKEASERHKKAVADRRVVLAKERSTLETREGDAFHKHQDAAAKAYAECEAAAEALKAAKTKLAGLLAARGVECQAFNFRMAELEGELRATADPAIDAFIGEMRDELEAALRAQPETEGRYERNANTGKFTYTPGPRRVRPGDRAQAIREAIAAAEGLKLEPKQDGVGERLATLRAALPQIGALAKGGAA